MRRIAVSSAIAALVSGALPLPVSAQPVLFTGNATADFAGDGALIVVDPAGVDVGMPLQFPPGRISGNDVEDIRLSYDAASDTLYVGFATYGIAGDVDGDGDAGRTSATLAGIGGTDMPDFGGTESFALLIDVDEDGDFDVIAGVSALSDLSGFTVSEFAGSPFAPGFAFGLPLDDHIGAVYGSPDADEPHVEFTILRFSELLAGQGELDASASFGINAFVGSFGDAGIGEDFTPGAGQVLDICLTPDDPEDTCNGFDDDCDGEIDEGVPGLGDVCSVGTGACRAPGIVLCGDGAPFCGGIPGRPRPELCDAVDNDCDGATDEGIGPDPITCGVGACAADGARICEGGVLIDDCTPGLAAAEVCDALDNDCDGDTDEGIAPVPTACGAGACADTGVLSCDGGVLVDSCSPGKGGAEVCDGIDNDCDGATDEGIAPTPIACGVGACASDGVRICEGGALVDDCTPGLAEAETCDGEDNDCDGATDEGISPVTSYCGEGACRNKGLTRCVDGALVDGCVPGAPGAELCNARDDDCDGATDEDIAPIPVACGVGACANDGERTCESGAWVGGCEPGDPGEEICNDVDDDCDGETDESVATYRITNYTGGRYGLMAWHFNDGGIFRWNMDDVLLTVRPDGTATMAGQVSVAIVESGPGQLGEVWDLEMQFAYRGQGDAFGGPKIEDESYQTPAVTAGWRYWDMTQGHMTRPGSIVKLEQRPRSGNYPFQLGLTANGKDRDLGVALWFYYTRYDDDGRMIASRGDMVAGAELIDDGCQPEPEVCDDVDNDADGAVDEGFGVGRPCTVGVGACEAEGTLACGPDGDVICDGQPGAPGEEICNGVDDDCDGRADEGLNVVEIVECGVGACAARGKQTCQGGQIVSNCRPGAPGEEICNEVDDDCDGEIDEEIGGETAYAAREYAAGGHAIYMPDFALRGITRMHLRDDARLTVDDDGTAALTGTAFIVGGPNQAGEEWTVDVNFAYRGQGPDFGGPKIERPAAQPPAITDLWQYYDLTDGTLTRPGSVVTLVQYPADGRYPMQLGDRANGKDDDFGLAVWFSWDRRDADGSGCDGVGDFNLDLDPIDACAPQPEVCNGEDDDRDGAIDEGFGTGEACWVGVGACMADGVVVCGPDGQPACDAEPGAPVGEVCDGADNDCDGTTDEGIGAIPTLCGAGACGARGEIACVDGRMTDTCTPGEPGVEVCNDEDDDCDGETDEGTRSYAVSAYAANGHGIVANAFGRNGGGVNLHFRDDARLVQRNDGSATLSGTAYAFAGDAPAGEEWRVEVELAYRGRGPEFGGPKIEQPQIQPPELQALWDYYDLVDGTLSRPGSIARLTQRPADGRFPYQMGPAANNKDADFGASVWFDFVREDDDGLRRVGNGDFNIDLDPIGDDGCFEAPEVCDGLDNDQDGAVDEGYGLGERCAVGAGACAAEGEVVCDAFLGSACDAVAGEPADEVCDGVDNDCDGATDEGIAAAPSDCGVGACGAEGEVVCVDGALVDTCAPGEPGEELCNDIDDDCDGQTDEGSRVYQADEYAFNGHAFDGHDFGRDGERVRMHFADDARFEVRDDGTARLTGTATVFGGGVFVQGEGEAEAPEEWTVELDFAYRGRGDAFGGPKIERPNLQPPAVSALWDYFDMVGGTISRPGSTATLTQAPADGRYPFQMGEAANNKDADFGASMWFTFHRVDDDGFESRGTGDFNLDLRHIADTGCVGSPEVCNDIDDDLDGAIDEGFGLGEACSIGVGACLADGVVVCGPDGEPTCDAEPGQPAAEACDGVDNDCDGAADEDIQPVPSECGQGACAARGEVICEAGCLVDTCEAGQPTAEACDGVDNDCDGAADEGIQPVPSECGQGACAARGEVICEAGCLVDTCEPGAPVAEICDAVDNDCDGAADEDIPPVPSECGVGACGATGEVICHEGCLVDTCEPGAPAEETCDETDEDCDGEVDEGTTSRVWDVSHFRGGHALWLAGFNREGRTVQMRFRDDATFFWHVDGTASVIGTAFVSDLGGGPGQRGQEWRAEFYLRDRGEGPDFGGPKIERPGVQTPAVTDTWHYWDIIGARLVRPEETVELTQRPVDGSFPFQFGWLANGKTDTLGAAVWFDWHRENADGTTRSGHGDLNVDLSGEAELCADPPIDPVCENTCRDEGERHMRQCVEMGFPAENCEALLGDWLDQCIMLQCC